jgi:hypothetical protein
MVEKEGESELALHLLSQGRKRVLRTGNIRMIVSGSGDWGYSRPFFFSATVMMMRRTGLFSGNDFPRIAFDNPARFYGAPHSNANV